MGYQKHEPRSIEVEFVDLTPGPRVIIRNKKFSLGLRITENGSLINDGARKEVRLFVLFKGGSYAKTKKRCTLRQSYENEETNVIFKDMVMDEMPACRPYIPDFQIQFKAELPLNKVKKEALSETFHLVQDAEYAKMYYDISEDEIEAEMNTVHHTQKSKKLALRGIDEDDPEWNFVENDAKLLEWLFFG